MLLTYLKPSSSALSIEIYLLKKWHWTLCYRLAPKLQNFEPLGFHFPSLTSRPIVHLNPYAGELTPFCLKRSLIEAVLFENFLFYCIRDQRFNILHLISGTKFRFLLISASIFWIFTRRSKTADLVRNLLFTTEIPDVTDGAKIGCNPTGYIFATLTQKVFKVTRHSGALRAPVRLQID